MEFTGIEPLIVKVGTDGKALVIIELKKLEDYDSDWLWQHSGRSTFIRGKRSSSCEIQKSILHATPPEHEMEERNEYAQISYASTPLEMALRPNGLQIFFLNRR